MFNFLNRKSQPRPFPQQKISEAVSSKTSDTIGYINPLFEIQVNDAKGNVLIQMPFCFLIHTHLKDYGFAPDEKLLNPSAQVILRIGKGQEVKLPLYIKQMPKGGGS